VFPESIVPAKKAAPPVSKLTFPPDNKPAAPASDGGVRLTFPDRPVRPVKVAVFDDTELFKQEQDKKVAKPLSFDNIPTPVPKAKPVTSIAAPKSLFESDDNQSVVKAAIKYVQETFTSLNCSYDRIERQIRQLTPLTLEVLMSWGANALTENGSLCSESAKLVKEFSDMNSTELMTAALKAAQQVPESQSFVSRLMGGKAPTLLNFKPRLQVLQPQLTSMSVTIDKLIKSTGEMEKRLLLNVAALAAICEVVGQPSDEALDRSMHERRTVLGQAANQAKLVNLQLVQIRTLVSDQTSRLVQLLNVTIPAFEMANATK
jgi:hypothetical protein